MTQLLTRREAAARMGFAPKTLANWKSDGKPDVPKSIPIGSRCMYDEADVEQWIEQKKKEAA